MIGTSLILAAALSAQSVTATFESSRAAYLKCMRKHLADSLNAKMPESEYAMAVAAACQTEQTAFHAAVMAMDKADGVKPADAKDNADMQVADYIESYKEKFADHNASGTIPGKE
jgi:hypothetical protein